MKKKIVVVENRQNFFMRYAKYKDLKNVKHWQYVFTKAERKRFFLAREKARERRKEYEEQSGIIHDQFGRVP